MLELLGIVLLPSAELCINRIKSTNLRIFADRGLYLTGTRPPGAPAVPASVNR
jgi:hypothetical protein